MLICSTACEEDRLQALHDVQILDTEPEEACQGIARLAKSALQVPIVLISLVDRDRQWFKARLGSEMLATPRNLSFCAIAVEQSEPLVIPDARRDPRFANNPLVTGSPYIRFYVGAQLKTRDGFNVGTICCIDTVPRTPSQEQFARSRPPMV